MRLLIVFLVIILFGGVSLGAKTINTPLLLSKDSTFILRSPVDSDSMSRLTYDILSSPSQEITLYLSTPGGSVLAGMSFIDTVKASGKVLTCIVDFAASMGFAIAQACDHRIILPNGIMMQHHASMGANHQPMPNLISLINLVERLVQKLEKMQADRLGITTKAFEELYKNDWWLLGKEAVKHKAADEVRSVQCPIDMIKETYEEVITIFIFTFNVTWSKCPLIQNPIKVDSENSWTAWRDLSGKQIKELNH